MKTKRKARSPSSDLTDIRCQLGGRPKNDKGYFEEMTKAVFRSGMKWDVVDKKWPGFKKAFANFSIQKVAGFGDPELERLMNDESIIRNHKKVIATLNNAREFLSIRKEHGSFAGYLKTTGRKGEETLWKDMSKRFAFMGGSTTLFFLRAVGEKMPEMMHQRQA
jgi:DNA-3-methyladenine glycosylase I